MEILILSEPKRDLEEKSGRTSLDEKRHPRRGPEVHRV